LTKNEHSSKTISELKGTLTDVEVEIKNTEMVQCSLAQLCYDPPDALARAVRTMVCSLYGPENTLTMNQVKSAIKRLCVRVGEATGPEPPVTPRTYTRVEKWMRLIASVGGYICPPNGLSPFPK